MSDTPIEVTSDLMYSSSQSTVNTLWSNGNPVICNYLKAGFSSVKKWKLCDVSVLWSVTWEEIWVLLKESDLSRNFITKMLKFVEILMVIFALTKNRTLFEITFWAIQHLLNKNWIPIVETTGCISNFSTVHFDKCLVQKFLGNSEREIKVMRNLAGRLKL
jgi:hypothetical protein